MKIRNIFNANEFNDNESEFSPSLTVPDQALSVRQILERYANGLPLGGSNESIWEGEEGFERDPETLDLAEREELAEKARQELKEINERIKQKVAEKKAKKRSEITDVKDENEENE